MMASHSISKLTVVFALITSGTMGCVAPQDTGTDEEASSQALTSPPCGVLPPLAPIGTVGALNRGESVTSCNGRYSLTVETDGSLRFKDGTRTLSTLFGAGFGGYGTFYDGAAALMLPVGQFIMTGVICSAAPPSQILNGRCDISKAPIQAVYNLTARYGLTPVHGSFLKVQDVGKLALIAPDGHEIWSGIPVP